MIPGDIYIVAEKTPKRGYKTKELEFVSESKHSFRFTNGKYMTTINKVDIQIGDVMITDKEEDVKMAKISKEELLNDCRELGTTMDAKKTIADKYGVTLGTLDNYFYKWRIKTALIAEHEAPPDRTAELSTVIQTGPLEAAPAEIATSEETADPQIEAEEIPPSAENFTEVPEKVKEISFKPVVVEAEISTYRMTKEGVFAEESRDKDKYITLAKINEMKAAYDLWVKHYKEVI